MFAGEIDPVPYAPDPCQVHQRLQGAVASKYAGSVPFPDSGWRQLDRPSQVTRAAGSSSGSGVRGAALPRIWKMMSSASVERVWPLVHADVRFCEMDAKLELSPNFESR